MTINHMETAGLGKMWHIFAASLGMLQMLSLILENSPFLYIVVISLNKILMKVKTCCSFFKSFNSSGIRSNVILLQTASHGISF